MPGETQLLDCEVCVVGAGTCGLYAAAFLGQLGIKTLLLEKTEDVRQEGRCVELSEDTLCDLQRVGLEAFFGKGVPKSRFAIFKSFQCGGGPAPSSSRPEDPSEEKMASTLSRRRLELEQDARMVVFESASVEEGPFGWPSSLQANPARLNEALLGRVCCECHSVEVKFGHEVLDILEEDDVVTVTCSRTRDESRVVVRSKFLIGAEDGAVVRRALCADDDWIDLDDKVPKLFFACDLKFLPCGGEMSIIKDYNRTEQNPSIRRRSAFVETSGAADRPAAFEWVDDELQLARVGYYAAPDETFASASQRDSIGAFLRARFGLTLGQDVEIIKFAQYWERCRVLRRSRRGGRCFLVGESLQDCHLGVDEVSLSLGIRGTANVCWKLAFSVKDYAPFEALAQTIDCELIPHALKAMDTSKTLNDIAFATNPLLKCFRDSCWSYIFKMQIDQRASAYVPFEADNAKSSLALNSTPFHAHWARACFGSGYIFSRAWRSPSNKKKKVFFPAQQLLTGLFPSRAVGVLFVQPFVVECTSLTSEYRSYQLPSQKFRLFEGVPLDAFVIIGFDDIDPRKHVSPGRLEVLHLIDAAFLTLVKTGNSSPLNDDDDEEVKDNIPLQSRSSDDDAASTRRRRLLREAQTGGVLVLPTWRKNHGDPDILLIRPDKFVFAAVAANQLNDAVDELLVKLGIKHDDPPHSSSDPNDCC